MNQITIEELSAYLPYGVKCNLTRRLFERQNIDLMGLEIAYNRDYFIIKSDVSYGLEHIQLCLRPISQLNTEIEVNGKKFVPSQDELLCKYEISTVRGFDFFDGMGGNENIFDLPYCAIQYLLSLHFDIFGLLDRNLAEPIV